MTTIRWRLSCAIFLASVLLIAGNARAMETPKATKSPILIGEFGPMTGPLSPLGVSTDRGIRLAVDQINASGGIDGHPLTIVLRDDEGTSDGVTNAMRQLTAYNKPTAIIGEVSSGRSLQAARVCTDWRIPMISPGATDPQVTALSPYIFRSCFVDSYQGSVAAEFACTELHATRAAILSDDGSAYSKQLAAAFVTRYRQLDGRIVSKQTYHTQDRDFRTQLRRVMAAEPDVLFIPGNAAEAGLIVAQAHELGCKIPVIGGDSLISAQFVSDATKASITCYLTDHYSTGDLNAANRVFIKSYQRQFDGALPDALVAMGYETVYVLAAALKHTPKPLDGDYASPAYRTQLRDALAATHDFRGLLGRFKIGPDRSPIKPAVIIKIQSGEFRYVRTVSSL